MWRAGRTSRAYSMCSIATSGKQSRHGRTQRRQSCRNDLRAIHAGSGNRLAAAGSEARRVGPRMNSRPRTLQRDASQPDTRNLPRQVGDRGRVVGVSTPFVEAASLAGRRGASSRIQGLVALWLRAVSVSTWFVEMVVKQTPTPAQPARPIHRPMRSRLVGTPGCGSSGIASGSWL